MSDQRGVIVVGAGIGGLVLARALATRGHAVDVVEVAPSLRAVGAGITLGANALRILGELGVGEAVNQRGRVLAGGAITDARGRVLSAADLSELEARYGKAIAIDRRALHETLSEGLPSDGPAPVRFHFGTTVEHAIEERDGIRVGLADGQELTGRALIGADGIRSAVRERFFGAREPTYAGYTCWRFAGRVPGGIDRLVEMWGSGTRVGLVPLHAADEVYAFFVANAPRGTPHDRTKGIAKSVRQRFADFGGDVPRVLAALGPDDAPLLHHDIEEIEVPVWSKGRVTLLGDAAHAMTPNLGQGAAMAIEDALVLARELTVAVPVPQALATYEAKRRPRVTDLQQRARRIGQVAQWESPFAVRARNWALALGPASATTKTVERIVSFVP